MKQRKRYRQKPETNVGFETDNDGHSAPVGTVDHPYFVRPGEDYQVCEKSSAAALPRDEAAELLNDRELSEIERRLVLGRVFDRASVRQLETETGKSKSWVAAKLKNPTIKQAIADLRSSQVSHTAKPQRPRRWFAAVRFWPIDRCSARVQMELKTLSPVEKLADPLFQRIRRGEATAQDVVDAVNENPSRLLIDYWQPLAQRFVDVCNAAQFGIASKDITGLNRHTARKALARLAKAKRGRQSNFPDKILSQWTMWFYFRVVELQREWRVRHDLATAATTRAARLEEFRASISHKHEFGAMSDRKLLAVLTSENPLNAAACLAEENTGLSAEVFLRACRKYPPEWWEAKIKEKFVALYTMPTP